MSITQFTMEEVRCFSERQTLEIRPLTFLVGENSTGKTTALSCFHVLANYLSGGEVDFNQSPYLMGTFKDILRNSKKKNKFSNSDLFISMPTKLWSQQWSLSKRVAELNPL